jgi:hypothetical protein
VEYDARRFLPGTAPAAKCTSGAASKIRCGRCHAANRLRHTVNVVGWNAAAVTGKATAAFHRGSKVTDSAGLTIQQPRDRP